MEGGTPILISDIDEGTAAYKCGQLRIGDAIFSVNGQSLTGLTHHDAVALIRATGNSVTLEVAFVIGVPEPPHDDEEGKLLVSERGLHVPPKLEDGFVPPTANGDPETPSGSGAGPPQPETQTSQTVGESHDGQAVESEPPLPPQELELSAAEKLASAFALTPSPAPLSTSDVELFWYKEAEDESPNTPVGRSLAAGHRSFFVTAHEVPYPIFPSPADAGEDEGQREEEMSTSGQEGSARRQSWKDEAVAMTMAEAVDGGPPTEDTPHVSEGDSSAIVPSDAPVPHQAEETAQVQPPTEAQVSTPAQARTFQMTVSTVHIQSLPYVDTDDSPLFSS